MREAYLILPLAVAVFCGLLAGLVIHSHARSPVHRIFALLLVAMTAWGLTIFGMRSSGSPEAASVWERAALIAVLSVPLFFYHFTRLFVRQVGEGWLLAALYLVSVTMSGFVLLGLVVRGMDQIWYGYSPRLGPLYSVYVGLAYSLTFFGIRNLVRYYRAPISEAARSRTLYILLGAGCSLLGGIFDSLPVLREVYPLGMVGNLFFALFTAVAILKHNLLDAHVVIRKGFVYSVISAAILAVYVLLLFSLNLAFQKNATSLSWPGNLAAVLTVAIVLKPLMDRFQRFADRWFARKRYDYLRALETFSREVKDITNLKQLASALEHVVSLAMGSADVRLLVSSANGSHFTCVTEGMYQGSPALQLPGSSPIATWLRHHESILTAEDLRTLPEFLALSTPEWAHLEDFPVQLLIPLKNKEKLVGVLLLCRKQSKEPYSEEDLDLIRAAANQTALALENARLFADAISQQTRLGQLLERVIRAQEDERQRLSLELHDSPVQWLTSTVYHLEAGLEFLRRGEYQKTRTALEEAKEGMDTTLAELRQTTVALRPPELEKVGLVKALVRHIEVFEQDTGILTSFRVTGIVPCFPAPVELAVYRVVQEALSNVRKHSQASRVEIQLGIHQGSFRVVIRDDGVGFDMDNGRQTDNGHLGLVGMQERARILGGTLTIQSAPRAGMRITLLVPLPKTARPLDQPDAAGKDAQGKSQKEKVAA